MAYYFIEWDNYFNYTKYKSIIIHILTLNYSQSFVNNEQTFCKSKIKFEFFVSAEI